MRKTDVVPANTKKAWKYGPLTFATLFAISAVTGHAQVGGSVSPPEFTAPLVVNPFPGAVPLVPAIGTSLSKVDGSESLNSVAATGAGEASVDAVSADVISLTGTPTDSTESRARRISAQPAGPSASSRGMIGGLPMNAFARQRRIGFQPAGVSTAGYGLAGPVGSLSPSGPSVRGESASYSKLDALSPEVLASRSPGARFSGSDLGLNVRIPSLASGQSGLSSSMGGPFAFRPSIASGISRPMHSAQKPPAATAGKFPGGSVGNRSRLPSINRGKLPNGSLSVPKIPHVGVPSPSMSLRRP